MRVSLQPVCSTVVKALPARARQSTFIGGFMSDPRLVRLVDKGVLEFVLWESTIECGKGARLKCWQPVLYSHAILAAWGTGPNLYLQLRGPRRVPGDPLPRLHRQRAGHHHHVLGRADAGALLSHASCWHVGFRVSDSVGSTGRGVIF